jgi:uncharacterized metal-binding protein
MNVLANSFRVASLTQQRCAIAFLVGVELSALNHLLLDGLLLPLPVSVKQRLKGN